MSDYYCPNCGADLEEQDGFDPEEGYWTCTSCGMMLTDPDVPSEDDVAWFCDNCGAFLNKQSGFESWYSSWICSECGHWNSLSASEIYESEEAYQASKSSSDDDEFGYGEEWQYDHPRRCESCDRLLNKQDGFEEDSGCFSCTVCGWYNTWSTDYNDNDQSAEDEANDSSTSDKGYSNNSSSHSTSANENTKSSNERSNDKSAQNQPVKRKQKVKKESKGIIQAILEFYVFLLKISVVILILGLIVGGVYYIYNGIDGMLNTIPIGMSSKDFQGMQYDKVIQYLKELGFENIEEKNIQDVTGKEIEKDGKVTAVSIGGNTEFNERKRIPYNKRITVIYRTVIPVSVPLSYKEAKEMEHSEVEKLFRDAGFVNIKDNIEYDVRLGWFNNEGEVESVAVDGNKKYKDDIQYRPDAEVIITYHALAADKPGK